MPPTGSSDDRRIATDDLVSTIRDAEFFRSLVENGSDAIISIDRNSTILFANEAAERVFGYEPEELIGEKLTVLMPERFHAQHFDAVDRYLETGERRLDWNTIELPAEHRDGHEVPLSITFEEHVYDGERVFSGIMRDISERVERERELERQNERLERFASIVSHDLRDPLNAARATAALAKAGDEAALDDLDDIFDRMERLIEEVLTLAKQGQTVGDTEPVDLASVAEDAWTIVDAEAATLVVADDLPAVEAHPERLETLLGNLFRNAVTHGGHDVVVAVGPLDDGRGFYVEDDGAGFGDVDPDRLFDYGFTGSDDGTGFGLSIVEEIAGAHGWTVTATTGADGGARFELALDP
ncbi:PAS domain S-box protein [Haloplanus halophilus]|uniref:PAS domain S-box protein n=1 Tax=Haloplanus halophilus TaxID=2949993 RepID=UPI00203A9255|nr:PAS domain-containing sensor histidine kinase [Haloplanus sp. GDY1]